MRLSSYRRFAAYTALFGAFIFAAAAAPSSAVTPPTLNATGANTITTPGGYTVKAEGKDAAWNVTTPNGKTTRIWGDPHVEEFDAGRWDFKKGMSFVLPDGTKITAALALVDGKPYSSRLTLVNGDWQCTVQGIEKNAPTMSRPRLRSATEKSPPTSHYAVLGGDGDDWFLTDGPVAAKTVLRDEVVGYSMGVFLTRTGSRALMVTEAMARAMAR